jgi:hypothetical protein
MSVTAERWLRWGPGVGDWCWSGARPSGVANLNAVLQPVDTWGVVPFVVVPARRSYTSCGTSVYGYTWLGYAELCTATGAVTNRQERAALRSGSCTSAKGSCEARKGKKRIVGPSRKEGRRMRGNEEK